jgi:hypothetical protein
MRWKTLLQNMSKQGKGTEDLPDISADANGGTPSRPREGIRPGAFRDSINADLLSAVRKFHDIALLWHSEEPADTSNSGSIAEKALHLHALNFALWHHEDAVRRPGVDDFEVARRKRCIDDLNARRNAAIEDIDVAVLESVDLNPSAPLYTETPGIIVDRLSVLTLRVLHTDRGEESSARLALLEEQYGDLFSGLEQFLARMHAGYVGFKLYRQFKSAAQQSYCDLFEGRDI